MENSRFRITRFLFVVILLIIIILQGCQNNRNLDSSTKKDKTFAMNVVVSNVPFWNDSKTAWSSLGKSLGVDTRFGGPSDDDSQKQITEIDMLIAQGVDALLIAPTDSKALTPTINKAIAEGIPVLTYLVDAPESNRLAYVTSMLEEASMQVGEHILKEYKRRGKVIISIGTAGSEEQERRKNGFVSIINKTPGLELIGIVEDKFDAEIGGDNIKAIMAKHNDIDFIFGCNSRSAAAAVLALKELKYTKGEVIVTGWDNDADVVSFIEEGWVAISAYQQTSYMTVIAFSILNSFLDDSIYPQNLDLKKYNVLPTPEVIKVPIKLIDENNAIAFKIVQK